MVVADISGSVASFARFTLQFVYAMAEPVLEGAVVGVHRRHRRGHPLLRGVRRHHRGGPPGEHRGRRRVGRRPLRLRPRVRGVPRAPHPRGHAEDVDHPARRRAQQLPRVAGVGRRRDAQAGPPRLLARPRAARLLGHRRLDRLRVRARTATASSSAATSASSSSSSPPSPRASSRPCAPCTRRSPRGGRRSARGSRRRAAPWARGRAPRRP